MTDTLTILGISGSLREGSFNTSLLRSAAELFPDGVTFQLYDGLGDIPHYSPDVDDDALRPASVEVLKRLVTEADGVLISSPEYNWSIPGVLKNALDWCSRPVLRSPFAAKPVGIMSASPGTVGGARGQAHLREVLAGMAAAWFPSPGIVLGSAAKRIEDGRLAGEADREFLAKYLASFVEFVRHAAT